MSTIKLFWRHSIVRNLIWDKHQTFMRLGPYRSYSEHGSPRSSECVRNPSWLRHTRKLAFSPWRVIHGGIILPVEWYFALMYYSQTELCLSMGYAHFEASWDMLILRLIFEAHFEASWKYTLVKVSRQDNNCKIELTRLQVYSMSFCKWPNMNLWALQKYGWR